VNHRKLFYTANAVSFMFTPMVHFFVAEGRQFCVHEAIICPRSSYVANAVRAPWFEAGGRRIVLSAIAPATFGLYVQLLYVSLLNCTSILALTTALLD
jgi:hypothetical protein